MGAAAQLVHAGYLAAAFCLGIKIYPALYKNIFQRHKIIYKTS
jgi:hypothetical protein